MIKNNIELNKQPRFPDIVQVSPSISIYLNTLLLYPSSYIRARNGLCCVAKGKPGPVPTTFAHSIGNSHRAAVLRQGGHIRVEQVFCCSSCFEYQLHIGRVGYSADIVQHVSVHYDYIGELSYFKRAKMFVQAQQARRA